MSERRIVRLVTGEDPDGPVDVKTKDWTGCDHVTGYSGTALVDESTGTVTCKECGERLEPFLVLAAIARHYRYRISEPLRALRVANQQYNENERRKYLNRVDRHRKRHPDYVGTCRVCQRLEYDGKQWAPQKLTAQ